MLKTPLSVTDMPKDKVISTGTGTPFAKLLNVTQSYFSQLSIADCNPLFIFRDNSSFRNTDVFMR